MGRSLGAEVEREGLQSLVRGRRGWSLLALALALVQLGCDASSSPPGVEPAGPIELSFESSTTTVVRGQSLTLSWTSQNVTSLRLFAGSLPLDLGDASPEGGSLEVAPLETTTFRLEARGAGEEVAERQLNVVVREPEAPRIASFAATPGVIGVGQAVALSWETSDAEAILIVDEQGRAVALEGTAPEQGSVMVHPLISSTYTLTAVGPGGRAVASTGVLIVPGPSVELVAQPEQLAIGGAATLRWELEGVTRLALFAVGEPPSLEDVELLRADEGAPLPRSFEVLPTRTSTYRLEVEGPGGAAHVTQRIGVVPVIESFDSDEEGPTRPGRPLTLRWSSRGASLVRLSNLSGWTHEANGSDAAAGSVVAPVGLSGSFVLVAAAEEFESSPQVVTVALTAAPRIVSFDFEPAEGLTAGGGVEAEGRVSWEVDGAEGALLLEKIPGGYVDLIAASNRVGGVDLPLEGPTLLRLTALNAAGQDQRELLAPIFPPPVIRSFTALPERIAAGESTTLSWNVSGAARTVLERDSIEVFTSSQAGSYQEALASPATYTLRSWNAVDFEGEPRTLTVGIGAPILARFSSSARYAQPGGHLSFAWASSGGNHLVLEEERSGERLRSWTIAEGERIVRGDLDLTAPEEIGAYRYVLRIENSAGLDELSLELDVTPLPVPLSFTALPPRITAGGEVRLGWTVADGVDGAKGRLELEDQRGNSYDLSGADPAADERSFPLEEEGLYTFTLHVIDEGGARTTATTAVEVQGRPVIRKLAASSPGYALEENQELTIEWETANAASLMLVSVSRTGADAQPLCSTADAAEVTAGSCTFRPTKEVPDVRLRVLHALGGEVVRTLRVGVRPVTIDSFTVEDEILLRGSSTTLHWSSSFGETHELGPRVVETREPYLDLSRLGGTPMGFNAGGTNGASKNLSFPGGFSFPYFGQALSEICVSTQGFLSLNTQGPRCIYDELYGNPPTSFAFTNVDIAPFFQSGLRRPTPADAAKDVFYLLQHDAEGRRSLIIEWAGFRKTPSASTNFEVVLHEDGRLEYRYGVMDCPSQSCRDAGDAVAAVNGFGAVLGYQDPGASALYLHLIPPFTEMHGGLSGRSFTLYPQQLEYAGEVAAEGSLSVSPMRSRRFTLSVSNGHSQDERSVWVEVRELGELLSVSSSPAEPVPDQPFTLHWQGSDLRSLAIRDEHGDLLFETSDPARLEEGSQLLPGLPAGEHLLTFEAEGFFGDRPERQLSLLVYPPYELTSFRAAPPSSEEAGGEVILSWEGIGLDTIALEAEGEVIPLPPSLDPNQGSFSVFPGRTTTYTLKVASVGREQERQLTVEVRSIRLDPIASPTVARFADEGPLTIGWRAIGEGFVSIDQQIPAAGAQNETYTLSPLPAWEEITATKPYVDITTLGGTVPITVTASSAVDWDLPGGFTFPWFGELRRWVRVLPYGGLSWNPAQPATGIVPGVMPSGNPWSVDIQIAIFNQHLNGCAIHGRLDEEEGTYTIQWKGCESVIPAANPSNLNFQVVLYGDGSFEYRYGAMTAANPIYATGQMAAIGWQSPSAKIGASLGYRIAVNPANRSWRQPFPIPPQGSFQVTPSANNVYEICAYNETWKECQEVRIAIASTASVIPTEIMPAPQGGKARWVEVRNLLEQDVNLRGAILRHQSTTAGTPKLHTIGTDVIVKGGGGYAVFSNIPVEGLPAGVPNYTFGEDLTFSGTSTYESFQLRTPANTLLLGSVLWRFALGSGASRAYAPDSQDLRVGLQPDPTQTNWCRGTGTYDSAGNLGSPGWTGPGCKAAASTLYDVDWFAADRFVDLRVVEGATPIPALNVDDAFIAYPGGLPWAFPFFGSVLPAGTTLSISSNGFTNFGPLTDSFPIGPKFLYQNVAPADGLLAPFWTDLRPTARSSFLALSTSVDGQGVLGLQWSEYGVVNFGIPMAGTVTFQIQLWENGDIIFAWGDVSPTLTDSYANSIWGLGIQDSGVSGETNYFLLNNADLFRGRTMVFLRK